MSEPLEQKRHLVTEIPGPESRARLERKKAHVADGVGTMLPVFVTRTRATTGSPVVPATTSSASCRNEVYDNP